MATVKMPICIKSEYVTMTIPPSYTQGRGARSFPPFLKQGGLTAYRYWQRPVPYGTGSILADLSYIVK